MKRIYKLLFLLIILPVFMYLVWDGYKASANYLEPEATPYYKYNPRESVVSRLDTFSMPPAEAVPMLIYHGVTKKADSENTELNEFIEQMEMLKVEGYETISLGDYAKFREGKLLLPAKPIIITFDDGRKDSYYPVDSIFEKLGFKGTIFVATKGAVENDPFYLNWEELKKAKESGRWEIEAHGRNSHDKIVIDADSSEAYFLSSRMYTSEKGLESIEDYEKRVEQDYINGINDLKENLGIDPTHFAKPLEDFGFRPRSNHEDALKFNDSLIKKYFKYAYIQANDSDELTRFNYTPYNFIDDDPYTIHRMQVKNMQASDLRKFLELYRPTKPVLNLTNANLEHFKGSYKSLYGELTFDEKGLHLNSTKEFKSARVTFGASHWENYIIETELQKLSGRSISLAAYLRGNTFVSVGITDNGLFLRETVNGVEKDLVPSLLLTGRQNSRNHLKIEFKDKTVTVYFNNRLIFNRVEIHASRGEVAFRVWDPIAKAQSILYNLRVYPAYDR